MYLLFISKKKVQSTIAVITLKTIKEVWAYEQLKFKLLKGAHDDDCFEVRYGGISF